MRSLCRSYSITFHYFKTTFTAEPKYYMKKKIIYYIFILKDVEELLKKLDFIPASIFTTDLTYLEFLDRVHKAELKLRAKGLWEVPHPWLNLFVPASRIADFDLGVFRGILGNKTSGPILIYPMNKHKYVIDSLFSHASCLHAWNIII